MNKIPERPKRSGISRRDFVQGRFWRRLKLGRNRSATPKNLSSESPEDSAVDSPPPQRQPLVMRYPRTESDVTAVNDSVKADDAVDSRSKVPVSAVSVVPVAVAPVSVSPVTVAPFESRRQSIPLLRPPGAIDEPSFLAGCTRCDKCVQACPHDAIVHAPALFREAVGTPMLVPENSPCMMCEDFPCIEACEPGVLSSLVPKMMGTAVVTEHLCLAHHGTTCTVCSERCPVSGAIDVIEGKPTVQEDRCTGCGVCRYVCPAPENAILLMPTFQRASR